MGTLHRYIITLGHYNTLSEWGMDVTFSSEYRIVELTNTHHIDIKFRICLECGIHKKYILVI